MVTLERIAAMALLLVAALWVYPQTREAARDASWFAVLAAVEVAWIALLGYVALRLP